MDINNTNPQNPGLGSTPSTSDNNNGSAVSVPDLGNPVGTTTGGDQMPAMPAATNDLPEMPTVDADQTPATDIPVVPPVNPVADPAPAPEPAPLPVETPTNESGSQDSGTGFDPAMPAPATEQTSVPADPVISPEPAPAPSTDAPSASQMPSAAVDAPTENSPAPTTAENA